MAATTMAMTSDIHERAQDLLTVFTSHPLHSNQLRAELFQRDNATGGQTSDFTSHSDQLVVDPNDLSRLENELLEYKTYFSQVKFSWMESNIKRRFISRILEANPSPLQQRDLQAREEARLDMKSALKHHKAQAAALQQSIASVADQLDIELTATNEAAEQARTLSRSIRGLELDLAVLRNNAHASTSSSTAFSRLTLPEADAELLRQTAEMATLETAMTTARATIAAKKAQLALAKRDVEALEAEKAVAEKRANEAREASKGGDQNVVRACAWFQTAEELLRRLVGVRDVRKVGRQGEETEIEVMYDRPTPTRLRLRYKSPSMAGQGALIGVTLLDSKIDISDLIEAHLPSNDTVSLVQDVLARVNAHLFSL